METLEARRLLSALTIRQLPATNGRLISVGDNVFILGDSLWTTDGSVKGTKLVQRFESRLWVGADLDGILYFRADDGIHGEELWRSDGTRKGTRMVADIVRGPDGSYPFAMTGFNHKLFFHAVTFPNDDGELWTSRGTAKTTKFFRDTDSVNSLDVVDEKLVLRTFKVTGNQTWWELWISDGTKGGMMNLGVDTAEFAKPILRFDGRWFYTGLGYLDATDLTQDGTIEIATTDSGEDVQETSGLIEAGERLFFINTSIDSYRHQPRSSELWISDGTSEGTRKLISFPAGALLGATASVGDTLFFTVAGPTPELWKSDGTADGTVLVRRFETPNMDLMIGQPVGAENKVYFTLGGFGSARGVGVSLWQSDGTADGTRSVAHLPEMGWPPSVRRLRGVLYIEAEHTYAARLTVPQIEGGTKEDGDLKISGTNRSDNIQLQKAGDMLRISAGGEERFIPLANISRIMVSLRGGDDRVTLGSGVPAARINGGPGNDLISGGSGDDYLIGGRGDDSIKGGGGNDVLLGGAGNDVLLGRDGKRDMIVGGGGDDHIKGDSELLWSDQVIEMQQQ